MQCSFFGFRVRVGRIVHEFHSLFFTSSSSVRLWVWFAVFLFFCNGTEERSAEDFLNELAEQALQAEEEDEYQQQLYDQQDFYDRGNPFQVDIGQLTVVVSQMVEDSAARFGE